MLLRFCEQKLKTTFWSQFFLVRHRSQWRWLQRQPSHHILANKVIEGPLHTPTLWLWKINENHSSNLVPSHTLQFFFPLFQTWHGARGLSAPAVAGPWSLVVSFSLPSRELTCYLLPSLPTSFSSEASAHEGQVSRLTEKLRGRIRSADRSQWDQTLGNVAESARD